MTQNLDFLNFLFVAIERLTTALPLGINLTSGSLPTLPNRITLFTDNTHSLFFKAKQFNVHTTDITAVKKKIPLNPWESYRYPPSKPPRKVPKN